MADLAEELPREQARVRKILGQYIEIGKIGLFGKAMVEQALDRAERAAASGNLVAMTTAYEELKTLK